MCMVKRNRVTGATNKLKELLGGLDVWMTWTCAKASDYSIVYDSDFHLILILLVVILSQNYSLYGIIIPTQIVPVFSGFKRNTLKNAFNSSNKINWLSEIRWDRIIELKLSKLLQLWVEVVNHMTLAIHSKLQSSNDKRSARDCTYDLSHRHATPQNHVTIQ